MPLKPIELDSILEILRERYENIPYHKVFFTMKQWGAINIRGKITVNILRACIAVETMGLPEITSRLVSACIQEPVKKIPAKLHNLGDLKILLLKRKRPKRYQPKGSIYSWVNYAYKLNPPFKKMFFGEK